MANNSKKSVFSHGVGEPKAVICSENFASETITISSKTAIIF